MIYLYPSYRDIREEDKRAILDLCTEAGLNGRDTLMVLATALNCTDPDAWMDDLNMYRAQQQAKDAA